MISVSLFCESRYPVDRRAIKKTAETVLGKQGVSGDVEVSIAIVGERKMHQLNKRYRSKDATTDVLSFSQTESLSTGEKVKSPPAPDGILRLGDVVISFPQARKNAS